MPCSVGRVEDKRKGDPAVSCPIHREGPVTAPGADGQRPVRPDSPANPVGIFTMLYAYHGEITGAPIMNYRNRVVAAPAKGARQAPHEVQPAAIQRAQFFVRVILAGQQMGARMPPHEILPVEFDRPRRFALHHRHGFRAVCGSAAT
jgi:hypothetical protein